MSTYKVISRPKYKWAELKSKKYKVTVTPLKGHLHITVMGPGYTRRGLTNIHSRVNNFELKAVALFFYQAARTLNKELKFHANYASIFGSCFD